MMLILWVQILSENLTDTSQRYQEALLGSRTSLQLIAGHVGQLESATRRSRQPSQLRNLHGRLEDMEG